MSKLNPRYELCYSSSQIADRIRELAREISPWLEAAAKSSGKPVVCLVVLQGGFFFAADLLRQIPVSMEIRSATASSYAMVENNRTNKVNIQLNASELSGLAVLVVEDICDTGATLLALEELLLANGVVGLRTAVAVHRKVPECKYSPTWAAFVYEAEEWFVGYGMDNDGMDRNLPQIYRIKLSVDS